MTRIPPHPRLPLLQAANRVEELRQRACIFGEGEFNACIAALAIDEALGWSELVEAAQAVVNPHMTPMEAIDAGQRLRLALARTKEPRT